VTGLALPLLVLVQLHGSALDVGSLRAAEFVPYLVLALPAGLIADRHQVRPLLVGCDLVRALALITIPIASAIGALNLPLVISVVVVVGSATVLFESAQLTAINELVAHDDIGAAQSALQGTGALASALGPGIAGALVSLVRASNALALDAISYALSALALSSIRPEKPKNTQRHAPHPVSGDLLAGVRHLTADRHLRPIVIYGAVANFTFTTAETAALVLAVRDLHISNNVLGLALAVGALGAPLGAASSGTLARRIGIGPTLILGAVLSGAGFLVLGLATTSWQAAVQFGGGFFLSLTGLLWFNVQSVTLRQTITPPALMGRVNAAANLVFYAAIPLGGLIGGALAQSLGNRTVVLAAGCLGVAIVGLLARPAIRTLRSLPS